MKRALPVALCALAPLILPLLAADPSQQAASTLPVPSHDEVALSLFLVGDAGKPAEPEEPVLASLRRDLALAGGRAIVAFLGDNLYPAGLPAPGHRDRRELERRLDAQMDAVLGTGARAVFVPGNHDWQKGGRDGWESVKRQERHLEARGAPTVVHEPSGGCPGPELVDDPGGRLRLVALDTQWWLHGHARPEHPDSGCAADSEDEVVAALGAALAGAGGRDVVVIMHHPLASGGPHGGHFTFRQHVFPLTDVKGALWLPLPLIGSIYPAARARGVSAQDVASREYRHMRDALVGAAKGRKPLAWAGGHEHVLQVIESPRLGRVLVSGSGIYGHTSPVGDVEGSLYRASRAGYMRIDFLKGDTRRLAVVEVAKDGSAREAYARLID
jgi:hypothetical protein